MSIHPKASEVYHVDLGMVQKPRSILIGSTDGEAPLAVVTGLYFATQFHGSPYEVALPKLPWMREQCYVNAQNLGEYKFIELQRIVG